MTSSITNNADYLQYLNSQLPNYPTQGGKDAKGALPGGIDLSQLLAVMGGDTSALTGLTGAAAAKGIKGPKSTAGQKYTRDGAASHLPPPRAPRVATTATTATAYASLADELKSAQQNAQTNTLNNPAVKAADTTSWRTSMDATGEEAAANMSQKVGDVLNGINVYQGDMMREFMQLRVKNGSQGLKELGQLSDLATDIQSTSLKEQEAKSREADAEAKKAQDKAAKLGIFSKILQVVMVVVTAILAVCTFGMGLPLLAIAAAAAIAFIAAGAAKGAKNGKGFDVMGGLDVAGYVADGVMMALGVGAALLAVQTAITTATKGVVEGVTKQMSEGITKTMAKTGAEFETKNGTSVVGKTATTATENMARLSSEQTLKNGGKELSETVSKEAFEEASKSGFKVIDGETVRTSAKEALDKGQKVDKGTMANLAALNAGDAMDSSVNITAENLLHNMNKQMAKQWLKEAGEISVKAKISQFNVLFKNALSNNFTKLGVTSATKIGSTVLGNDFGTRMMRLGLVTGGVQGTAALGQGGIQYASTMHQTNAEEAQAIIKLLNSTVEMFNGQYDTLQSTMQNITESRSKAIDAAQAMLKSDQQVNTMMANNFVTR